MMIRRHPPGFTGRHMLLIMLAFFGTIVGVNFTMAWLARSSWTGFVVENSYVASQHFNEKLAATRAQAALGWSGRLAYRAGALRYAVTDSRGQSVALKAVRLTFKRPVDDREDRAVELIDVGQGFEASHTLADGVWIVEIVAEAGLPDPFRDTRRISIREGSLK